MAFELYTNAALARDIPEYRLRRGDVVTIIDFHASSSGENGYSIEVFDALGGTVAVTAVPESDLESLRNDEVLSVRPLTAGVGQYSLTERMSDPHVQEDVIEFDEVPMQWEEHARAAIESAVATIEKDEVRGVIYMRTGEDARFSPIQEEFTSWEEVRHTLVELGENEWINYVPFDSGEPVFLPSVDGFVEAAMTRYGVEEFFESVSPPEEGEKLARAHDLVAHRAGLVVQVDLAEINAELVRYLAEHPEKMYELKPRLFEKLVADLFRAKGYEVELGPGRKDRGVDIRAFLRTDVGALLTLIQCKRYSPKHKINVDVVRQLNGVVNRDNASAGIIVTTSTFTRDARSEQQQLEHRIHLAEYADLTNWLRAYPQPGRGN